MYGKRFVESCIELLTVVFFECGIRIWGRGVKVYFYFLFCILYISIFYCLYCLVMLIFSCMIVLIKRRKKIFMGNEFDIICVLW